MMTPTKTATSDDNPLLTCRLSTVQHALGYDVTIDIGNPNTREFTKISQRLPSLEEAIAFVRQLAGATTESVNQLEHSSQPQSWGGNPAVPFSPSEDSLPAGFFLEVGRDDEGYVLKTHIVNEQSEILRRDLTFPSKAGVLQFLSEIEEAVPMAVQMIEHAEC